MINKALYRILSLSLWNIDQSVTCIRDHIDDYKEDGRFAAKPFLTKKQRKAGTGCSVAQSCSTLCDPMDYSTPGFPVLHYLPKCAQVHVH